MVAPAVGPTLSGYLIDWFNWRFLFIVNIPVAIFAILMVSVLLKETEKSAGKPFDRLGFMLTATSAGTLLYALSNGQSKGWTSLEIVTLFFISFWAFVFLLWVETGKEHPIIDLSLFKNFTYTLSVITSSLVMIGMFGGVFLTPIFLQNIQGVSAIDTGILLMPQAIAMALMMPVAGRLFDKIGVIPLGLVGLTIMSVTTYELHRLTIDTPHEWLDTVLVIRGIGIGLCMMPLSTAGMNAVAPHQVGNASSVSNLVRQVAASMGLAVLTAIMQKRTTQHLQHISESVTVASSQTVQDTFGTSGVSMLSGIMQLEATTRGIGDTFLLSSLPLFVAIPLVFLFKQKKKQPQEQTK
jgi:EmrB/QacA subfamily drug resistance transporter